MINVNDLIGVKYAKNGRSRVTGYDCYGLAIEVSKRFGHEMPDIDKAREDNYDFNECYQIGVQQMNLKEIESPTNEGDIVLIHECRGPMSHVGIYLGNGQVIHCDYNGVHIDKLLRLRGLIGKVYTWQ